jgi:RNA polymerase sigma factor (sigma-70 family)
MDVDKTLDDLYRKNFAKMVIALAKYTGLHDLAAAEDIVQDAFVEATRQWRASFFPHHPEAWLYGVCRKLAYRAFRDGKLKRETSVYESDQTVQYQIGHLFEDVGEDDQLRMLYASCHPDFAPKSQVIFALRYVGGFRIGQIAVLLGMQAEAVTKTLLRIRQTITQKNIRFLSGNMKRASGKTPVVLKVLYLMFSEGYSSSRGKSVLNLELCEEALSLTQCIVQSPSLTCPEAEGLLALMLFSLSRFESRFNENGELVDLENQDRSQWNKDLMSVAEFHLGHARHASYSTWHLEAAVAFLHSKASSFTSTDWTGIASIYGKILTANDSPFTRLNQAIALFYSGKRTEALAIMDHLGHSAIMQQYHLYHVALGKFHLHCSNRPVARRHLELAITLTRHKSEKEFIRKLIGATAARD